MSIEKTFQDMQDRIDDLRRQRNVYKEACNEILFVHCNDDSRPKAFYIAAKAVTESERGINRD